MDVICSKLKHYFKGEFSDSMEEIIDSLYEMCDNLNQGLRGMNKESEQRILLKQHLERALELTSTFNDKFPDFSEGLEWVNVTEPLFINKQLKGKLILLDFFTYCCINCMHILADLKKLENEFSVEDGFVVVGVHSAKFSNEKVTKNIESAVRRYEIHHPVVNDSLEGMWSSLRVTCWPTIMILGPKGEPLLTLQGEGHYDTLRLFISEALKYFNSSSQLSINGIPEISKYSIPKMVGLLSYPGKVSVSNDGCLLAISDTAHHRVVISNNEGYIKEIIGGPISGFADGDFETAKFNSPQGLCFVENNLFVADTENHSIRKIDLTLKNVSTVVGNGKQGHDYKGGGKGLSQAISSPWDVCHIEKFNVLFIAMAGTHQIWAYSLENTKFWNEEIEAAVCLNVIGSGAEENRNGAYRKRVGLAQPSGLSASEGFVYFADSESSAVRAISLENGAVSSVCGATLDPRNLFAYGDVDGVAMDAKLQHPLGVAVGPDGLVYIVDSYNHKIKVVNPSSKQCKTLDSFKYQLNEPGGLACHNNQLYIADTNNHSILVLNLKDTSVKSLDIKHSVKSSAVSKVRSEGEFKVIVSPGGTLKINVTVTSGANKDICPSWKLFYPVEKEIGEVKEGSRVNWTIKCNDVEAEATIKARSTICKDDTCQLDQFSFTISIIPSKTAPSESELNIDHCLA